MNTNRVLEKIFGPNYQHQKEIEAALQRAYDEMMSQRTDDEHKRKFQATFAPSDAYHSFRSELTKIFGKGEHEVGKAHLILHPNMADDTLMVEVLLQAYFNNPELDNWVDGIRKTQQEKGYKPGWVWYQIKNKTHAIVANYFCN